MPMGFFRKILSTFLASPAEATALNPAFDMATDTGQIGGLSAPLPFESSILEELTTMPAWLRDDDTLRDEAVIFGLSASSPADKIAIIHNYFLNQTAHYDAMLRQSQEKIQDFKQQMVQIQNKIDVFESQNIDQVETGTNYQIPRVAVGFMLSVAMCIGNFYLIEQSIRPNFGDNSLVAVGVFLAGMFNVFGKISIFHDTTAKVGWRKILEEIGMPAASSVFVFAQVIQNQSIERALALLLFTFFLFLFAGKLLLSNLSVLTTEIGLLMNRVRLSRQKQVRDGQIQVLKSELTVLSDQKWELTTSANRMEADLTRLNARRDMLIKLFESEFNLARTLRNQLTGQQMGQLLNQNYSDSE